MYEYFYGLSSDPFRLLPDPGICFPHRSCGRAWAYLRYALKRGEGIVVVTGPPGSGKTTLAHRLLGEANPSKIISVNLVVNDLSPADLLRKLAYALGLPVEGKDRAMLTLLIERHLAEVQRTQRRVLVIIDEAQSLSHQALEAMRLLTDLQSQAQPVMQLVLFGQEELEGVMSAPGMEQFQHRVIASSRLQPMSLTETKAYLEYRLAAADWHGDPSISGPAVMAIYRYSRGIPRHVNKIGSRLMLHGSSEERHALEESDVMAVVSDLRRELLAPLSHNEAPQAVDGDLLQSVYELALVPGEKPQSSRPAEPTTVPSARSTIAQAGGLGAPMPADSAGRHGGVRGQNRYLLEAGRRRTRLRHRVSRRLRRYWANTRFAPTRAGQYGRDLLARSRARVREAGLMTMHGFRHARSATVARLQSARETLQRPLPRIVAIASAGLVSGLVLLAYLGGADNGAAPVTAAASRYLQEDQPAPRIGAGVLDGGGGYLLSGATAGEEARVVFSTLRTMMQGGFLSPDDADHRALASLLGDPPSPPATGRTGEARRDWDGHADVQSLVATIGDESAYDLLSGAGRFAGSLTVWAMAYDPDAVSREGVHVWSTRRGGVSSAMPSVAIRSPGNRQGAVFVADARPSDPAMPTEGGGEIGAPEAPTALASAADASMPAVGEVAAPAGETGAATPPGIAGPVPDPMAPDGTTGLAGRIAGADAVTGDTHSNAVVAPAADAGDTDVTALQAAAAVADRTVASMRADDGGASAEDGGPAVGAADVAAGNPAVDGTAFEIDEGDGVSDPRSIPVSLAVDDAGSGLPAAPDVTALIAKADEAISENRLSVPEATSAFTYLRQALAIDADNAEARRRLDSIVERYVTWALAAMRDESYDKADRFAGRALRVQPDSRRAQQLRREIRVAREEAAEVALAEAERARRLAAAESAARSRPAPTPPQEQLSSFQRLMRLVEGN